MAKNYTKVKISDIAERASVSAGTVDRVIHNRGEVAPKTREKILQIISEMNYEPDILASTLASKKSLRFSILIPRIDKNNSFWSLPAEGIQAAWEEIKHFGVALEKHYFTFHDQNSYKKKLATIIKTKPSGLILAPIYAASTIEYMKLLKQQEIPVVFLNTLVEDQENLFYVGQDSRQSGIVAAHLLNYGLSAGATVYIINIYTELSGNTHIHNRELGFREYFHNVSSENGRKIVTININSLHSQEIEQTLSDKIDMTEPKAGIFVTNSRVFHVAAFLEKNKLKHFRLIGYDLLKENQHYLKHFTIDFLISQKPWEQGYKCVTGLFNTLVMKRKVPTHQYLPIDIITRENIDYYLNI